MNRWYEKYKKLLRDSDNQINKINQKGKLMKKINVKVC